MSCLITAPALPVLDALAPTEFNRELNALLATLEALEERLGAFVNMDPTPELTAELRAQGYAGGEIADAVAEFWASTDSPRFAQDAVAALAWTVRAVGAELRGMAQPVPAAPRRTRRTR